MQWAKEEVDQLQNDWGETSVKALSRRLNRTESAVINKARRLKLGAFLDSGGYLTYSQLTKALNRGYNSSLKGLKTTRKKVNSNSFRVVKLEDFWKWAESNKNAIDWSKTEKLFLGPEPAWVDSLRWQKSAKNSPWTAKEDQELKSLLKLHRYGIQEIANRLNRSCGAVQRRICDLSVYERPIKADNHKKWTEAEIEAVKLYLRRGYSYVAISAEIESRSEKAIRGLVYRLCGTEVLDNARRRI